MAELKTAPNERSVEAFLKRVEDPKRREDAIRLLKVMKAVTKQAPQMWGDSIVGFGRYHYVYDTGREGDWFLTGFSPRKGSLTVYIMAGFDEYETLLERLGPHRKGKSCLYLKSLDTIHLPTLKQLVAKSIRQVKARYG